MNSDNRNVILAVVLSMLVLFGWQFFVAGPQMERQQRQNEIAAQQQAEQAALAVPATSADGTQVAATDQPLSSQTFADRQSAIAASTRVAIDTEDLSGSINLTGARIDDLRLENIAKPSTPILRSSRS